MSFFFIYSTVQKKCKRNSVFFRLDQVSIHRGQVLFGVIRWQITSFQMIAGSSLICFKFIGSMWCTFYAAQLKILISNWPRTRKFSQLLQAGQTVAFDFAHHDHALVTNFVKLLCCDWSRFDRWVHAASCLLFTWQLKLTEFCVFWVFNCLFRLDVKNEIQLLSGVLWYSWIVCLLDFWLRNTSLVKVGIRFRMSGLQSLKRCWPYLIAFRAASIMVSLSNYCILCLFFYLI